MVVHFSHRRQCSRRNWPSTGRKRTMDRSRSDGSTKPNNHHLCARSTQKVSNRVLHTDLANHQLFPIEMSRQRSFDKYRRKLETGWLLRRLEGNDLSSMENERALYFTVPWTKHDLIAQNTWGAAITAEKDLFTRMEWDVPEILRVMAKDN